MSREGVRMAGVAKQRVRKCQQKCYPLEPVLEDCVAKVEEAPRKRASQCGPGKSKERFKGKSVLTRLRDGYVKLMNDMASSADLTAVSAVYGCSVGQVDFPVAAAMASVRSAQQDEEAEQLALMAVHSRIKH